MAKEESVSSLARIYQDYVNIAKEYGDRVLFDNLETLSLCILYVFKQKVSWLVHRRMPIDPWGDFVVAARAIEERFGILGRAVDSDLFLAIVLKCLFAASYEKFQASRSDLSSLYCLAGPEGHINDNLFLAVLRQLSEDDRRLLVETASEVSCGKIDFMFCLGREIEEVFSRIANPA